MWEVGFILADERFLDFLEVVLVFVAILEGLDVFVDRCRFDVVREAFLVLVVARVGFALTQDRS